MGELITKNNRQYFNMIKGDAVLQNKQFLKIKTQLYDALYRNNNITLRELRVLMYLIKQTYIIKGIYRVIDRRTHDATNKRISEETNIAENAISTIKTALEKKGYIGICDGDVAVNIKKICDPTGNGF
jgi:DNA-binding MarR family transcriptional regulator